MNQSCHNCEDQHRCARLNDFIEAIEAKGAELDVGQKEGLAEHIAGDCDEYEQDF